MQIESYSFGSMIVAGQTHRKDLIVLPDRVRSNWWRRQGHVLEIADLDEILDFKPAVLVIGTGAFGLMKVPRETREVLRSRGIEVLIARTEEACTLFNDRDRQDLRVAGAFHLTC